ELKQEKSIKLGPEIALANLIDSYLEVLDTWIFKLRRTSKPVIKKAKHEAIKRYSKNGIGIESDLGSNTANNIESACEIWKKKVEKLKKTTRKSKSENTNEPEKYGKSTLNPACESWTKRVDEFKGMIKYSHELKDLERQEIADEKVNPNGAGTPEKNYERPIEPNSEKEKEKFEQYENGFRIDERKSPEPNRRPADKDCINNKNMELDKEISGLDFRYENGTENKNKETLGPSPCDQIRISAERNKVDISKYQKAHKVLEKPTYVG
ncbi:29004_t:CDS:2, partial [Gigaspora margarita]